MDLISELRRDKAYFEEIDRHYARGEYCKDCDEHNENCPYYDAEEECWDYEACYKDSGGWK